MIRFEQLTRPLLRQRPFFSGDGTGRGTDPAPCSFLSLSADMQLHGGGELRPESERKNDHTVFLTCHGSPDSGGKMRAVVTESGFFSFFIFHSPFSFLILQPHNINIKKTIQYKGNKRELFWNEKSGASGKAKKHGRSGKTGASACSFIISRKYRPWCTDRGLCASESRPRSGRPPRTALCFGPDV